MKIHFKRTYPHSIEAVWQALTDPRSIRQWWVDTDFQPVAGHSFFMQDVPQGSWDGRVTGEILEVDPPHRIRFSWSGGGHSTEVTYELSEAAEGGTRLDLRHDGFRGVGGLFLSLMLRFGWAGFVKRDVPYLAGHIERHGFERAFERPPKAERTAKKRAA